MDTPIGPPPMWRPALPAPDDVFEAPEDLFASRIAFGTEGLTELLLEKALAMLESGSEKTRTKVLHDLLDAQGLLGKRHNRSADDPESLPDARVTQNILVANPSLAEALSALSRGLKRSEEPADD